MDLDYVFLSFGIIDNLIAMYYFKMMIVAIYSRWYNLKHIAFFYKLFNCFIVFINSSSDTFGMIFEGVGGRI